jgi:hypothetical protein
MIFQIFICSHLLLLLVHVGDKQLLFLILASISSFVPKQQIPFKEESKELSTKTSTLQIQKEF